MGTEKHDEVEDSTELVKKHPRSLANNMMLSHSIKTSQQPDFACGKMNVLGKVIITLLYSDFVARVPGKSLEGLQA